MRWILLLCILVVGAGVLCQTPHAFQCASKHHLTAVWYGLNVAGNRTVIAAMRFGCSNNVTSAVFAATSAGQNGPLTLAVRNAMQRDWVASYGSKGELVAVSGLVVQEGAGGQLSLGGSILGSDTNASIPCPSGRSYSRVSAVGNATHLSGLGFSCTDDPKPFAILRSGGIVISNTKNVAYGIGDSLVVQAMRDETPIFKNLRPFDYVCLRWTISGTTLNACMRENITFSHADLTSQWHFLAADAAGLLTLRDRTLAAGGNFSTRFETFMTFEVRSPYWPEPLRGNYTVTIDTGSPDFVFMVGSVALGPYNEALCTRSYLVGGSLRYVLGIEWSDAILQMEVFCSDGRGLVAHSGGTHVNQKTELLANCQGGINRMAVVESSFNFPAGVQFGCIGTNDNISLAVVGAQTGRAVYTQWCDQGQVAKGVRANAGNYVAGLGLFCEPVIFETRVLEEINVNIAVNASQLALFVAHHPLDQQVLSTWLPDNEGLEYLVSVHVGFDSRHVQLWLDDQARDVLSLEEQRSDRAKLRFSQLDQLPASLGMVVQLRIDALGIKEEHRIGLKVSLTVLDDANNTSLILGAVLGGVGAVLAAGVVLAVRRQRYSRRLLTSRIKAKTMGDSTDQGNVTKSHGFSNTVTMTMTVMQSKMPISVPGYLRLEVGRDFEIGASFARGGSGLLCHGLFLRDNIQQRHPYPVAVKLFHKDEDVRT